MGTQPPKIAAPEEGKSHMTIPQFTIALFSVAILAFIVVAAFVTIWRRQDTDALTRLLEIIFAPIVAVVAVAVAFYYKGS